MTYSDISEFGVLLKVAKLFDKAGDGMDYIFSESPALKTKMLIVIMHDGRPLYFAERRDKGYTIRLLDKVGVKVQELMYNKSVEEMFLMGLGMWEAYPQTENDICGADDYIKYAPMIKEYIEKGYTQIIEEHGLPDVL